MLKKISKSLKNQTKPKQKTNKQNRVETLEGIQPCVKRSRNGHTFI